MSSVIFPAESMTRALMMSVRISCNIEVVVSVQSLQRMRERRARKFSWEACHN